MVNPENIKNFILDNFPEATEVSGHRGEYQFNSPLHNDGKKRLYVNIISGKWFDQKEQRGGNNFVWFIKEYLDCTYSEAVKALENDYSYLVKEDIEENNIEEPENILDQIKYVKWFDIEKEEFAPSEAKALNYLCSRRIDPRGLGFIDNPESAFYNRIIIPFYEEGELVYFIARTIDPDNPIRYKNLKGISAKDVLFNYDKIDEEVFIFEGVFDAMSLKTQVGTAILSNLLKEEQADKLIHKWNLKRIIFVPDVDQNPKTRRLILKNLIKGYKQLKALKQFKRNIEFYIYNIPNGYKDFNQYSVETLTDSIDLNDCVKFDEVKINLEIMRITNGA